MKCGFTGTRKGMSLDQTDTFQRLVQSMGISEFHHGCCQGADEQAVIFARYVLPADRIVAHPPSETGFVSVESIRLSGVVRQPEPYLKRDMQIVRESWLLLATPGTFDEVMRSGTWATIRYGRAANHPVFIIRPDGLIEVK